VALPPHSSLSQTLVTYSLHSTLKGVIDDAYPIDQGYLIWACDLPRHLNPSDELRTRKGGLFIRERYRNPRLYFVSCECGPGDPCPLIANCLTVGDPTAYQTAQERKLPLGGVLLLPQKSIICRAHWRPILQMRFLN
jgi:hypothetical protein